MLLVEPPGCGRDQAAPAFLVTLIRPPTAPALPPAKHFMVLTQAIDQYQALAAPT
jgi:hypothetical protein